MHIKGNDSAQVLFLLIIAFSISPSSFSASSINSGVCFRLKLTLCTIEANWIFLPKRFYLPFAFLVLSWLYMHDQGSINEWLLPPHKQSAATSVDIFRWFLEFLPTVEHFAFSTPAFGDIFVCSVTLSALVTPVGITSERLVFLTETLLPRRMFCLLYH